MRWGNRKNFYVAVIGFLIAPIFGYAESGQTDRPIPDFPGASLNQATKPAESPGAPEGETLGRGKGAEPIFPEKLKIAVPPRPNTPVAPSVSAPSPPQTTLPSTLWPEKSTVDPRTGEQYPGVFGGVINPQTGETMPKVDGGYINPRTGEFLPGRK